MKSFQKSLFLTLLMGGAIFQNLLGNTVKVENSLGEVFEIGIDSNDRFFDVLDNIELCLRGDIGVGSNKNNELLGSNSITPANDLQWNLVVTYAGMTARAQGGGCRDYLNPPTSEQRDDIAYILTELAWSSPVTIWNKQSELEKAGARIECVHPLHFLRVIFGNNKLIAAISAINERKVPKLKSKFFKGLTDSLKQEAGRNNLMQFVDDFAKKLDINKKKIIPSLESGKYEQFVDILIELNPREDADRHIM